MITQWYIGTMLISLMLGHFFHFVLKCYTLCKPCMNTYQILSCLKYLQILKNLLTFKNLERN